MDEIIGEHVLNMQSMLDPLDEHEQRVLTNLLKKVLVNEYE